MKKIVQNFVYSFRKVLSRFGFITLGAIIAVSMISQVHAYSTIDSQLDFGETNRDVTSLQTFFADNAQMYPSGLVTGYFGSLTKAAVLRFQMTYGIDQAGRVGPVTRDKINALILSGGWTGTTPSDSVATSPRFYNVYRSQTANSLVVSFNTDEVTTARVVYHTNPLMFNEGDINSVGFGPIGGFTAFRDSVLSKSHSITVPNLQPNTIYYYTVIATDVSGDVSVWGPNNAMRTNTQ